MNCKSPKLQFNGSREFELPTGDMLVVDQKSKAEVIERLEGQGVATYEIGSIRQRKGDEEQVQIRFPAGVK